MDFQWGDEEATFRHELRQFLADELPDDWDDLSKDGPGSEAQAAFSRQFCGRLAEKGWLTPHWPTEFGGGGKGAWFHAVLGEEMWAVGEPRGPQYMNVNWIGPAIQRYGTAEQHKQHLPPISSGSVLWCQGFSEPDAGSDLAALRTRAIRDGDEYIVNGQKLWTSYANHADYCFLLVRTDPEKAGTKGISVLLVPMSTEGISVREVPSMVGERYFHEIYFTQVRVPVDCRLGPENGGWQVVTFALAQERVGAARYARAARVIDALAADAAELGRLDDPLLQVRLGAARAACEAARVLAYKVIDQRDRGEPPAPDTNVARVANTRADLAVADLALAVHGADALEYGSIADANYRLAITAGVAVGATEVQLDLIARRFLALDPNAKARS
ncbi:acyl-CoA dehydrogenase family protein [Mycolicibacterium moriokaense]|uniref:Alkylation response protein AidB-like acyl-CoA dehydrogenase n=1 Tax=Mycolicibacterium moriokaense TaxID=39691 RepID=A0A318HBI3_9MYCO|nr:acyl-CoA dehydrogenase family protein [Mycolicibacterium moriokaense]PXX01637.1 alkylation response protein AidB-like acyl-CoA dehydrogenase [Mycolicibacterium moriokaense]